jgi:uncharacterized protein (DUF1778 family)
MKKVRKKAVADPQLFELSANDSRAFAEGLLNPPPVNDRLRETIQRYREAEGSPPRLSRSSAAKRKI